MNFGNVLILPALKVHQLEEDLSRKTADKAKYTNIDLRAKYLHEKSEFRPKSPYASSKLLSFWFTKNYRDSHKIFACNGILFNHEGTTRGENLVTKKITRFVAKYHNEKKGFYI